MTPVQRVPNSGTRPQQTRMEHAPASFLSGWAANRNGGILIDDAFGLRSRRGVFEDAAEPGRFVETFLVASWLEHLRQHERVTRADRLLQERMQRLLLQPAKVTHLVVAEQGRTPPRKIGDQPGSP